MPNRTTASLGSILGALPTRWRRVEIAVTVHPVVADVTAAAEVDRAARWLGTWGIDSRPGQSEGELLVTLTPDTLSRLTGRADAFARDFLGAEMALSAVAAMAHSTQELQDIDAYVRAAYAELELIKGSGPDGLHTWTVA